MKKLSIYVAFVVLVFVTPACTQSVTPQQDEKLSFQTFYDEMSPYGSWVRNPSFGYVWIPNVPAGFSPYVTAGQWRFTEAGWTWVSDYPWGWAAFHYGRWDCDDTFGWVWVPETEWGPAWVVWRKSAGYFGWVPLRPWISLPTAFGDGYYEITDRWSFVKSTDIARSDIGAFCIPRSQITEVLRTSEKVIATQRNIKRNATYITGPGMIEVRNAKTVAFVPIAIEDLSRPEGQRRNGQIQMYRPWVQKRNNDGQNNVPVKIRNLSDVRPVWSPSYSSKTQRDKP